VNAQLESFYLCLTPEFLLALNDFVTASQSPEVETKSQPSINCLPSSVAVRNDLPLPAKPSSMYHQLNRHSSDQSASISTASSVRTSSVQVSSDIKSDLETKIDILIKTSQICWLENQHDPHTNCLVLAVRE
jgi:hypothetical protein